LVTSMVSRVHLATDCPHGLVAAVLVHSLTARDTSIPLQFRCSLGQNVVGRVVRTMSGCCLSRFWTDHKVVCMLNLQMPPKGLRSRRLQVRALPRIFADKGLTFTRPDEEPKALRKRCSSGPSRTSCDGLTCRAHRCRGSPSEWVSGAIDITCATMMLVHMIPMQREHTARGRHRGLSLRRRKVQLVSGHFDSFP